jgi:hypothetical protein
MSTIFNFKVKRSLGNIVRVTATDHGDTVWIALFRAGYTGSGLRRAGGLRCTREQFRAGVRVILNYINDDGTVSKSDQRSGRSNCTPDRIVLTQISNNVFVYQPPIHVPTPAPTPVPAPVPPTVLAPVPVPAPLVPPPPSPVPLTEEELLDAEHESWYDDVVPVVSVREPHRFARMNFQRERWIFRGRRIGELPPFRLQRVAMKARNMFR